jgi:pimeloyl-ACP methyl ester carboxylesterase
MPNRLLTGPPTSNLRIVNQESSVALIHGCTQGPTGWRKVQTCLSNRGIASIAVDVDPALFNESGATECAQEIARQLEGVDRVILVSTSCSGLLAPVVATIRPVERLVFVCAGLPDIGRSATSQIAEDGVLRRDWMEVDFDPEDLETAERYMFHDCSDENLDWSLSTVRLLLPPRVYDEVTPLRSWPDVPCTYVLGIKDRVINPDWARETVPTRLGVEPIEIDTGHCPQNSHPELLGGILAQAVAGG